MLARRITVSALALLPALATFTQPGQAQQPARRYLYAALPGVGGGSATTDGGIGILVFDIDSGHKFVKRIPLQGAPTGSGAESVRGIAANAQTSRLYVSTSRRLVAYDLITEKLVWEQRYENRGIDRVAVSPDGKTLYAPGLGAPKWHVVDAATGALITSIDKVGSAHNTFIPEDGRFAYLERQGRTRMMTVADARTHTLVREIGPFSDVVRPFTINGKQTLVFANLNNLLGFEVADINTGKMLHRVEVPGVTPGRQMNSHLGVSNHHVRTALDNPVALRPGISQNQRMASRTIPVDDLTADERVELMGQLWDSLDPAAAAPMTDALAAELDRREAEADAAPEAGEPWPQIKADLTKRLR